MDLYGVLLYEVFTVGKTNKKDITILHCTMQQIQDITYAQGFCFSTNIMYKLYYTLYLHQQILTPWHLEKHFGSKLINPKRGQLSEKLNRI